MFASGKKVIAVAYLSRFAVHRTVAQSIPYDTYTKVEFNVEEYDDNSEYDHETNFKWTCKVNGKYHLGTAVGIDGLIDTEKQVVILLKNGSITFLKNTDTEGAAVAGDMSISGDGYFVLGDTIEVTTYHNKDAGKNTGTLSRCRFWGHRFG